MTLDPHTKALVKSARRIHREMLNNKVKQASKAKHEWLPNDGRPIIGVNEDRATRKDNPYVVLRDVVYRHQALKDIEIKEGTLTDLGSIPWLLKVIPGFRPTDPGLRSFLVHDVGYRLQLAERRLLDTIMESGLIADGMKPWQAELCYYGVRLGGWYLYNRYAAAKFDELDEE